MIGHFPEHRVYVEPFGGAAGVLTRKAPADAEVYNDLDGEIVNVFRVLRDQDLARRLAHACSLTPYAREEFELAQESSNCPVEQARRTLFRAWSSFGSAGATRGRSGMRTFSKPDGRYLNVPRAWGRVADMIPAFVERFAGVIVENRPAMDVMLQHDCSETLHYVDPPYLPETRTFDGGRYYRHEMTRDQHVELLQFLGKLEGHVIVSGYSSDLYRDMLDGWDRVELGTSGSSRFGSVERTECLWLSPSVSRERERKEQQQDLFIGVQA